MLRTISILAGVLAFGWVGATPPANADGEGCQRVDMEVQCSVTQQRILVGDPFEAVARVTNTGDVALEKVTLALQGRAGTRQVGDAPLSTVFEKIAPGETQELKGRFVAEAVGQARFDASARDQFGWAAAGCHCAATVEGLPALQLEMIDLDIDRNPQGIFEKGQSFLYVLDVENDMGTAVTPELKVTWLLPPSLAFVSGVGNRGVTVTGSGINAESSPFVLAPNEKQSFEIVVKVVDVPPEQWVQSRASVVTSGGIELATETESTTLRPASEK